MQSFIPWIGGKRALRKEIISHFPAEPPKRYIEVFGGAAWVLFGKDMIPGQMEVYNDINGDLVNLFRIVKYHPTALQQELLLLPQSRELFFDFRAQMASTGLTDIQRAARYFYVVKESFGADLRTFATAPKAAVDMDFTAISERLHKVIIEHRDYRDLIRTYDRPDTLFYLDPPYVDTEHYYDAPFGADDHQALREILSAVKGRWILSYNDCPFIRGLYKDFCVTLIERRNILPAKANSTKYAEIIVQNY